MIDMTEVTYHFAPMELYVLFGIGVACYAISASSRSVKNGRFVGRLVPFLFYASWSPLFLHYVVILFWLPPTIFVNPNTVLTNPSDLNELSKYVAYYIHIIVVFLFFLWIFFLLRVRYVRQDEQQKPSDEEVPEEVPEETQRVREDAQHRRERRRRRRQDGNRE